jgi:methionyl-tRNA synthetase
MNRKLITSALPYVNNIPHLGNLIQMLSADVFARFCRSRGYDTLYVCGTDEYGTATETRALEEKKSPRELCDYYHAIHEDIYKWFDIAFDNFGRTSTPQQTEIVQSIFKDLDKNGYIHEHISEQLFCPHCKRFLADRYVRGSCPKCGYEDARGDQCEQCGTLLDPTDLKNPRCSTCGSTPELKKTKHLYIDLPSIQNEYSVWMEQASKEGKWSANAVQMTKAWIRDGLQERAITRDLKWGIPVPKEGYENKVFYVWFDAPIGYISITKELADRLTEEGKKSFDWKSWWLPSESLNETNETSPVELFQFIGKDNIPFHTVIFPSSLIGTGKNWTKLYHMSSTEYLNYEDGKFSKSKGIGVFGSDAKESGIPADAWRFYIFYNRPEKADTQFTWKDFQEKYNGELIGNLGNLVNRTLLFVTKYYDGKIPESSVDEKMWAKVREYENAITENLEWANLKDAFHEIFSVSDMANKFFQAAEPWKTRTEAPEKAAFLIYNLCYVIKDLMILAHPYLPRYTQKIMSFFGKSLQDSRIGVPAVEESLSWKDLGKTVGLETVGPTEVYFKTLDKKTTEDYRQRYAGSQNDRKKKKESSREKKESQKLVVDQLTHFNKHIVLKVAKIISIERNPDSDKLYIEHLDDGSGRDRVIQSGLVPYLREDELLGLHVIIADNLKPRLMRGVESRGMLIAADYTDEKGKISVEPLTAPWAAPGTLVIPEGATETAEKDREIDAEVFFQVKIQVINKRVVVDGVSLVADGKPLCTEMTVNGFVR